MWKRLFIRLCVGLVLFGVIAAAGAYWLFRYGLNKPLTIPEKFSVYTVERGANLRGIARDMAEARVMDYPTAVAWAVFGQLQGKAQRIKAGEYGLPNGASANRIMDILIAGKSVEYALALVEGWTFQQVMEAVVSHPNLEQTLSGKSDAEIMVTLGFPSVHPEGRFFPDTYHFNTGMTDAEFLRRAYLKMQDELAAAWTARADNLPLDSSEQVLILASLIEKETGQPEEREAIAGVFIRRLQKNMRLQTDPTVIYGLGDAYEGNLRKADLQRDTPYNTYTRKGLPPTPIAMPGRAALRAAVNPASGKHLFFVARGDGSHVFSETLRDHECAVLEFQLKPNAPKRFANRCRAMPYCKVCQR